MPPLTLRLLMLTVTQRFRAPAAMALALAPATALPMALAMTLAMAFTICAVPTALRAQAADPKPVTPLLDFSGVLMGNYRYTYDDATRNANGGLATSKFDVERVYLNFRMPAGERGSIRVTTDVFNNAVSGASCVGCYAGWNVRLKYAYFQYNLLQDIGGQKGFTLAARLGMLHTAIVDHEEGFFPRWVSQVAIERNGFFASSDLGLAGLLTLPKKWGELYATIANGSGYSAVENDPYKDFSVRLSLTPFANEAHIFKTFTISPYLYRGTSASKFLTSAGSSGNSLTDGLKKNRTGVFLGLKDRRLTLGAEWGRRTETVETGATIATRGTYDNSGTVTSGFALVRPVELLGTDPKVHSPFGLIARVDTFTPFSSSISAATQTTSARNQLLIFGVFWDLNAKASFSVDFQNLKPHGGSATAESKVLFAHWNIAF